MCEERKGERGVTREREERGEEEREMCELGGRNEGDVRMRGRCEGGRVERGEEGRENGGREERGVWKGVWTECTR